MSTNFAGAVSLGMHVNVGIIVAKVSDAIQLSILSQEKSNPSHSQNEIVT